MKKIFRSRGIRIYLDSNKIRVQQKIYYEPEEGLCIQNDEIIYLQKKNIISYFEYSQLSTGEIDTYNFHVNLMNDYQELYNGLTNTEHKIVSNLSQILGNTFRNYTVGYRIKENFLTQRSFYFYPTILRDNRYGIKGITDSEQIQAVVSNLGRFMNVLGDIEEYGKLIYKFKGVSVHFYNNQVAYKVYGRINSDKLEKYLKSKVDHNLNIQYGEPILIALRVDDENIVGYNIYYLH